MKKLFLAFGLFWIAATMLWAQSDPIENTIQGQFTAFQSRDIGAAFDFASPSIQQKFIGPKQFGTMVERGFPMVWNSGEIRFLEQREIAGTTWQKVMVQDAMGRLHMLAYQMINQDGAWKINGVQILPSPDVGA